MFDNDNKFNINYEEEDQFVAYDFSPIQFDEMQRIPNPPGGFNPNFQPPNFPGNNMPNTNFPNPNFPGNNPPSNNPPGGNINPSTLGAPPSHIPNKNQKGVQSFTNQGTSKAVSQNSIRFCLFQFTYIWERSGRAYWAYLLNVDRVSVSGLRWLGRRWVFFGVDLRRIDSFICYRNNSVNCNEDNLYRSSTESSFESNKKLYSNSAVRDSISKKLVSLDIPETKDDFIVKTIGIVDDNAIQSSIPCVKYRNTEYSINLEVTYPETIDENIKDKIIKYANESSEEITNILNSSRGNSPSINPLENFDSYTKLISKALDSFSSEFNSKLRDPEINKDLARSINYNITQCKFTDNWKTKL